MVFLVESTLTGKGSFFAWSSDITVTCFSEICFDQITKIMLITTASTAKVEAIKTILRISLFYTMFVVFLGVYESVLV